MQNLPCLERIVRQKIVKLSMVMNMKNSKEMLSSILKTTQMGQIGIRSVLDHAKKAEFRTALHDQLAEYDTIETQAHNIASAKGWDVAELDPAIRFIADTMTRMRLSHSNQDSKIAGMMIQGNTKGMITSLKNLHQYSMPDSAIQKLSQKLLTCEQNNIRQMKDFL